MVIKLYRFMIFIAWLAILTWVALELDKMQFFKF
jgi:hypothetical protein